MVVATRGQHYSVGTSPASHYTGGVPYVGDTCRVKAEFPAGASCVQLGFGNHSGPGNPITIKASVETSTGMKIPVYFNGARTLILSRYSQTVFCDELGYSFAPGDTGYIVVLVDDGNAGYAPNIIIDTALGESISTNLDVTDSGSAIPTSLFTRRTCSGYSARPFASATGVKRSDVTSTAWPSTWRATRTSCRCRILPSAITSCSAAIGFTSSWRITTESPSARSA